MPDALRLVFGLSGCPFLAGYGLPLSFYASPGSVCEKWRFFVPVLYHFCSTFDCLSFQKIRMKILLSCMYGLCVVCGLPFSKSRLPGGGVYIPPLILRFRSWGSLSVVRANGCMDFLSPLPPAAGVLCSLSGWVWDIVPCGCRHSALLAAAFMPVK